MTMWWPTFEQRVIWTLESEDILWNEEIKYAARTAKLKADMEEAADALREQQSRDRQRSPSADRDRYNNNDRNGRNRSRSPARDDNHNRESRRERSPPANGDREREDRGSRRDSRPRRRSTYENGSAPPQRSHEERAQHKEQMMNSVRDGSQQDRRVYVGNLTYDVKWHTLKDYMRQGKFNSSLVTKHIARANTDTCSQLEMYYSRMCCKCPTGCQRYDGGVSAGRRLSLVGFVGWVTDGRVLPVF